MAAPIVQATATNAQNAKFFCSTHFFGSPPYPTKRFDGQTVIVTGSNTGLGLEAARHFVRLGAGKVILAVRSVERGEEAAVSILESEKREGVVEVWKLDLGNYNSVKEFAARASKLERLDVVVNNAGVYLYDFTTAEDNETTITVNVVSTFLLGILLLPKLRETSVELGKPSVLTFVGSFVHYLTKFPEGAAERILEGLAKEKGARMTDRYNISKSMQLFLLRELAARLSASSTPGQVITSILNPGFVNTTIMKHNKEVLFNAFMFVWRKIAGRTPEAGSRTLVHAAGAGVETHGMYLDNCEVGRIAEWIADERRVKIQEKLWREVGEKLESISPGVMSLI